jgi:hypothetical protein
MILKHNYDIEIDVSSDGKTAVDMFTKNLSKTCCNVRYKMILMDVNIVGKIDGFEATKVILALDKANLSKL